VAIGWPERPGVQGQSRGDAPDRVRLILPRALATVCAASAIGVGGWYGAHASGSTPEWPAPNADLAGTRSVEGTGLNAASMPRLRRAWRFVLHERPTFSGVLAGTPLVVAGRVYVQTLRSNVFALDARTGKLVWKRSFERESGGPNGLASAGGLVFGNTDRAAFALDRETGALVWTRRRTDARQPIDVAPAAARGLVITGTTAPRPGGKGSIIALDAATGAVRWRRTIVPGRWANPEVASGGGVWWTPTVDGGTLYAGTSNPLPWGGTPAEPNGAALGGRALYTDSLLALDLRSGALRWYDQVTPHDIRDYDFALPPVLARAAGRNLVVGSGKGGWVIAWDRETRRRAWTAAIGTHLHDRGPLPRGRVTVCPGLLGGVLTPLAVSRGRVFVPSVELCMRGSATGYENLMSIDYAARARGLFSALALADGSRLWTRKLPSPVFGCATATGDAVVTSTYSGRVYAFAARDGTTLWTAQEPAGVNACPAVAAGLLVVAAGAEPSSIRTPTAVVDAYRVGGTG
jgi:alcohol dehydrogenase (cytochrome c)